MFDRNIDQPAGPIQVHMQSDVDASGFPLLDIVVTIPCHLKSDSVMSSGFKDLSSIAFSKYSRVHRNYQELISTTSTRPCVCASDKSQM